MRLIWRWLSPLPLLLVRRLTSGDKGCGAGRRDCAASFSSWMNKLVVMPDSPKLPYWDVVMMVCLVWVAAVTPWETAFLELECVSGATRI